MAEVTLEFISRQIALLREHVDRRLDAIEAQVRQMVQGHDQRIRRLEDASAEG